MQKLALLLLLAVTISLITPFESVLAQESEDEMVEDEMMDEEVMEETSEDEVMEDEMTEDEMMEDEMIEEEMEEHVDSPLVQMSLGTDPHEIQCKSGQTLVFKAGNFKPACVNESSVPLLQARGWVSDHDPTHEELTPMMDKYMPSEEMEEEMTEDEMMEDEVMEDEMTEDEMMEEEMEETEETTEETSDIQPQSYVVELSEAMQMGTQ
jgi:pentapeptide MXKDX repeat protein